MSRVCARGADNGINTKEDIMDENTRSVIAIIVLFGWIPILAIGKAISWCIQAFKK